MAAGNKKPYMLLSPQVSLPPGIRVKGPVAQFSNITAIQSLRYENRTLKVCGCIYEKYFTV